MADELENLRNILDLAEKTGNWLHYREAPPETREKVSEELMEYVSWGKLEHRLPHLTQLTKERVLAIGRGNTERPEKEVPQAGKVPCRGDGEAESLGPKRSVPGSAAEGTGEDQAGNEGPKKRARQRRSRDHGSEAAENGN